ncbi:MAG: autotransporter domain-containing protein [Sulfuritalea sp.]|jgi:outer membrane autotransporter protein|nr:autotransporter domain-containing protein [Sulfuritalea sp.]
MKIRIMSVSVAAAMLACGTSAWAGTPEAVALPGVVGPTGVLEGVTTAGIGILTVGNNQNINTNGINANAITPNAANNADVRFMGNSTVTGNVGIPSLLLNFDAGAVGSTVNFNGLVNTTTFNVSGTGTINFNNNVIGAGNFASDGFINLAAGRTLTGAIITATAATGTFTLNGGSIVNGAMGGANGLKQINVVGGNASVTGAVQARSFDLGANTLAIGGALTTNAGGTIATTLAGNTVYGKIVVNTANINGGGITVVPTVTGVLTTGTTYKIVDSQVGPGGVPVNVINNSPRYTFAGVPTTLGAVSIRLTAVTPLATLVTAPGAAAVAPILEVTAPAGSDLLTVQNSIAVLPNAAAINSALLQLAPGAANLAAPWVAGQTARLFDDLWMARVDEIQSLCCSTCEPNKSGAPVNAHECKGTEQRSNWWGKGFASQGRQGDVDNLSGYRSEALGLMLAYDRPLNADTRVGLGGAYANTTIDGNNSTGRTKVDSYQLTAYFSHAPGPWFVQGAVTAGADQYNGSRSIAFAGVNRTASADYTGQQYSAVVTVGKHFHLSQATVTPLASLQATRISVESYTEDGAGDANLRVSSQKYNFVQSTLGVKAERVIQAGNGTYSPEVHLKWLHDFSSTTMQQDAAFAGGGTSFSTQGINQDRELFNVGAGISFLSCNCGENSWTVKGLYDYKWNQSSYSSHKLSILASRRF